MRLRRDGSHGRDRGSRSSFWAVLALLAAFVVQGCVSARVTDREATEMFRAGRYDEAAARLDAGWKKQGPGGRDALLYLLDLGLAQHQAGKYEESIQTFLKADELAEIKDYTSLATEAGTLFTSDNIRQYKGEEFENVLISTYLSLNFALIGKREDAIVEARRVNRKLERMIDEGKRKYQLNAFARYLSGILYEADGNWNSAYVDYKKTYELDAQLPGLGSDLWRAAHALGMRDETERWEKTLGLERKVELEKARERSPKAGKGEIVVIYQNGIAPEKIPNPDFYSLPTFRARYNPVRSAKILLNGEERGETYALFDIERVAMVNLQEKYGAMVARKVAGVVAKEVAAAELGRRTKSAALGEVARLAMYLSDQADCRSWSLLPRDLQIGRYLVEPGTYAVKAVPVGAGELPEKTIAVAAGEKVFVTFRFMP